MRVNPRLYAAADSRHLLPLRRATRFVRARPPAEQHQTRDNGRLELLIVKRRRCAARVDTGTLNGKAISDGDANIRPERDEDFDPGIWLRRRGWVDGAGGSCRPGARSCPGARCWRELF